MSARRLRMRAFAIIKLSVVLLATPGCCSGWVSVLKWSPDSRRIVYEDHLYP
jgi:hypothetical protein